MTETSPEPDRARTAVLDVTQRSAVDPGRARSALTRLEWLGDLLDEPPSPNTQRVRADLELPIRDGSGPSPIRVAALIDVGLPEDRDRTIVAAISWQSASLAPLFPVFAGRLIIRDAELTIAGRYAPPLGRLGLVIDGRILHFVARRTAAALLSRLVARME